MLGSILVTVGLALDIIGVALLLAGPRVHARGSFLRLAGGDAPVSTLRARWSKLGWFGLPIVSSGFALQILGELSQYLETCWLVALGAVILPAAFGGSLWLVQRLPQND